MLPHPQSPRLASTQLGGRTVRTAAALVAVILVLASATAMLGQPSSPGDAADLFSEVIDVRVVNVEVVVTDRDGNRVSGLAPDDFRLFVDGRETPIDYFSEVRSGEAVESPADGPPGIEAGGEVGTNFLLFVDDNHTFKNERDIVVRGLLADLSFLGPRDRMAVVVQSGSRLVTLASWTGDREHLRGALGRLLDPEEFGGALRSPLFTARQRALRGSISGHDVERTAPSGPGSTAFGSSLPSAASGRFLGNPADLPTLPGLAPFREAQLRDRRLDLENAMSGALSTLRGFDRPSGRKVMLLLTGNWPLGVYPQSGTSFATLTELDVVTPLIETANLLGYTLYPINDRPTVSVWRNQTTNRIAARTGGRALFDRTAVLDDAVSDTRSYYWLGFTPEMAGDDLRHRLRVEVSREGLEVRNRSSYVDLSREAELAMDTQGAVLFADDFDDSGFEMEFGTPRRFRLRKMEVPVTVSIPLDELTALPVAGSDQIQLELRFAVVDDTGSQASVPMVPVTLRGQHDPGEVYQFETLLEMRRRPHEIVASVHDPATGRLLVTRSHIAFRK